MEKVYRQRQPLGVTRPLEHFFSYYFFHRSAHCLMTSGFWMLPQPVAGSGESPHAFAVSVRRFSIADSMSSRCFVALTTSYCEWSARCATRESSCWSARRCAVSEAVLVTPAMSWSMRPSAFCEDCTLVSAACASGETCESMTCCENASELVAALIFASFSWNGVHCMVGGLVVGSVTTHVPCAAYSRTFGTTSDQHCRSSPRNWLMVSVRFFAIAFIMPRKLLSTCRAEFKMVRAAFTAAPITPCEDSLATLSRYEGWPATLFERPERPLLSVSACVVTPAKSAPIIWPMSFDCSSCRTEEPRTCWYDSCTTDEGVNIFSANGSCALSVTA